MYVVRSPNFFFLKSDFFLVVVLTFNLLYFAGSFLSLNIRSPEEFLEGQPSKVTCTATFTCLKQAPVFKWSYGNMPAFTTTSQIAKTQWKSESTLTFTASANDNGRSLTCYMQFNDGTGRQEAMVPLRVKSELLSHSSNFQTLLVASNGLGLR